MKKRLFMKKKSVLFAVLQASAFMSVMAVLQTAHAGLVYTPVAPHPASVKLAGVAVQCIPVVGTRPEIHGKAQTTLTLVCKPQTLHMRGIAATHENLKLLFAGKGYDAQMKVYQLKYHTIGSGKMLQASEKVGG